MRAESTSDGDIQRAYNERLDQADDDKNKIATAQIELQTAFYQLSLSHAARSFRWGLISTIAGAFFFLTAIILFLISPSWMPPIIVLTIGGVSCMLIGAINFYLYKNNLVAVKEQQEKIGETQDFLLKSSLLNSPEGDLGHFSVKQRATLQRFSNAKSNDIQEIASSQLEFMNSYYELSLSQARRSFRTALIASVTGLMFFLGIITFALIGKTSIELTAVGVIGGIMAEFIAGINFLLYGKTLVQLNLFHGKLENTQRFMLANSLCEHLPTDERKELARFRLIERLTGGAGEADLTETPVSTDLHNDSTANG